MNQFDMSGSPSGPEPKRLLLAVLITSMVLMVYSYFNAPTPVEVPVATVTPPVDTVPKAVAPVEVAEEELGFEGATGNDVEAVSQTFEVLDKAEIKHSSSYRAQVDNYGGFISEFTLTDFSTEKTLFDNAELHTPLLVLKSVNPQINLDEKTPYVVLENTPTHMLLRHITKQGLSISRNYQFLHDGVVKERIEVKNLTAVPQKVELSLQLKKGDKKVAEPGLFFNSTGVQGQSIAVKSADKHEKFSYKDLEGKPKSFTDISYVAFDEQYFLSAFIPEKKGQIQSAQAVVTDQGNDEHLAELNILFSPLILVMNETAVFEHRLFVGPKQIDLLSSMTPKLDENIEFGWFGVISRPMLWLLVQINNFVGNYGWAIILITFVIKLLTYPLTQKSFTSQAQMKKLAPKIKELQQKYGNDRTMLGQKQMELYRSEGINPMAGCLPMLVQLPIWFAFFQMLRSSVELYDQPFYWWITDLTQPDRYFVLPIIMGLSMLAQQIISPPPSDQPHMKYVMWGMPVFFTFIMLNMPSGLSLYIFTNNILTIAQQMIIKNKTDKIAVS
jgi:YidC/Oxa1 family membrane protein insertase